MASQNRAHGHTRSSSRHASTTSASFSNNGPVLLEQSVDVPSDIDLTLRNIRFLNLDLHPDWPGITRDTFRDGNRDAKQKARAKIQTAEWVLYKLYELYDSKETRAKLQQFFPALEPRQSISLRAALFQLLTALKQNGLLPRECTLRRSVLDECRGERFEELLFYFSSLVLRHVLSKAKPGRESFLGRIATSTTLSTAETSQFEPLTLALRKGLAASLDRRRDLTTRLQGLQATVITQGEELAERNANDKVALGILEKLLYESNADSTNLKSQLRNTCEANLGWINLAISGDNNTDRMPAFEAHFDHLWQETLLGTKVRFDKSEARPETVLAELDARVSAAKDRLENWRAFQTTLSMRNEELNISRSPHKTPRKSPSKGSPAKSPQKSKVPNPSTPRSPSKAGATAAHSQVRRTTQYTKVPGQEHGMFEASGPKASSQDLASVIDNANPSPSLPRTLRLDKSPLSRPPTSDKSSKSAITYGSNASASAADDRHLVDPVIRNYMVPGANQTMRSHEGREGSTSPRELRRTPMTFTISRPYIGMPTITKLDLSKPPSTSQVTATTLAEADLSEREHAAKPPEGRLAERIPSPRSLAERARKSMALVDTLQGQRTAFLASADADVRHGGLVTGSRPLEERRPSPRPSSLENPSSAGTTDRAQERNAMTLSDRVQVSMGNRTTLGATDRPCSIDQQPANKIKYTHGHRASKSVANGYAGKTVPQHGDDGLDGITTAMGTVMIGGSDSNDQDATTDTRPKTPIGELFNEGADYGSVFKSRSKMRRSPPPSASGPDVRQSPWY